VLLVSHTTKFSFFTNCSKGEHKDTATTTALPQAPFIQQKQVEKVATKHTYSFCTQSSHVSQLVEHNQPHHQQVHENLQQPNQHNFSNKVNNSSRCIFNKQFSLSPKHSTQWRPLLQRNGDHYFYLRTFIIDWDKNCKKENKYITNMSVRKLDLLALLSITYQHIDLFLSSRTK